MRRRNVVPARTFAPVAISCLIVLTACAKGQERADTTAQPMISSVSTPASVQAPRVIQANLPGALPKPLDSLSGDELYDFTHKLVYGGGVEKDRECKGSPECKASKPLMTKLRVDAIDGQDSLSVFGLPDNGVVTVKALNKGVYEDELYGMKPGKNLEYYLVVFPGTSLEGRWRLEQLVTTAGSRSHTQIAKGTFKPCMHQWIKKKVNRANFFTCSDAHMTNDSVSSSGLMKQGFNPPFWVDCAQGCCIAASP